MRITSRRLSLSLAHFGTIVYDLLLLLLFKK